MNIARLPPNFITRAKRRLGCWSATFSPMMCTRWLSTSLAQYYWGVEPTHDISRYTL